MIGIVGSGGFVEYDEGIPMFEGPIRAKLAAGGLMPDEKGRYPYAYLSNIKGKQYIYGGQINITRKINDNFSAAFGIRANYYDGYNRGYVEAISPSSATNSIDLVNLRLNCIQRAWGFTPLFSFAYHDDRLTISARYELRTKINTKNDTEELSIYQIGQERPTDVKALAEQMGNDKTVAALSQAVGEDMAGKVKAFLPDEEVRYDMPSLLSVAVGYNFTPQLPSAVVVSAPTTASPTVTSRTPRLPATATASASVAPGTSTRRCASTSVTSARSTATTRRVPSRTTRARPLPASRPIAAPTTSLASVSTTSSNHLI